MPPARPKCSRVLWATAMTTGRGPVVVAVNEDVWTQTVDAPALSSPVIARPHVPAADADAIAALLARASNPVLVVGGTGWSQTGVAALRNLTQATDRRS